MVLTCTSQQALRNTCRKHVLQRHRLYKVQKVGSVQSQDLVSRRQCLRGCTRSSRARTRTRTPPSSPHSSTELDPRSLPRSSKNTVHVRPPPSSSSCTRARTDLRCWTRTPGKFRCSRQKCGGCPAPGASVPHAPSRPRCTHRTEEDPSSRGALTHRVAANFRPWKPFSGPRDKSAIIGGAFTTGHHGG